jgi:UDP:flavonoid glycosyltransferase YjiC (YdhE family)
VAATRNGHVRVTCHPVDLQTAARKAELVVSYAPLGLLTQACIAGVPQVLAPMDVEKMLAARRVMATGRGVVVRRADRVSQAVEAAGEIDIAPLRWDAPSARWLQGVLA